MQPRQKNIAINLSVAKLRRFIAMRRGVPFSKRERLLQVLHKYVKKPRLGCP
jgi:hypothetical protein